MGPDQPVIDRDISRDQSGKAMHNARGDPNNDLASCCWTSSVSAEIKRKCGNQG